MSVDPRYIRVQELWAQAKATRDPAAKQRALRELVLQAPTDPDAHFEYGRSLAESRRDDSAAAAAFQEALRLDPTHADSRVALGIIHHRRGEHDQAAGMYGAAVAANPRLVRGWLNLGALEMDRRDFRAALSAYKKAAKLQPKDARTRSGLALALHAMRRYEDAVDHWRGALRHSPDDPGALKGLARSLKALKGDAAIDAYYTAIDVNPESVSLRRDLAELLDAAGDAEAAEEILREGIADKPSEPRAYVALGEFLRTHDRARDAIPPLREGLVQTAGAEPARMELVRVMCDLGRLDDATRELRPVVIADPMHVKARRLMAALQACEGLYDDARGTAYAALKLQPTVPWPRALLMEVPARPERPMKVGVVGSRELPSHIGYALTVRGILQLALGEARAAGKLLEQAVQAAPESAVPRVGRALVHMDRDNVEAAYAELRTAAILDPGNFHVHHLFGEAAFHTGKYEEAAQAFQAALATGETDPLLTGLTHFCRARAFRKRGHGREAIEAYQEAQRLVPEHHQSFFGCGVALQESGRHEEALRDYERAAALSPNHAPALMGMASCLETVGRAPEAVQAYRSAIKADPRYAAPRYNLAVLIERTGDPAEVASLLRSYIRLAPKAANISDAQRRLTLAELRASGALKSPELLGDRPDAPDPRDEVFLSSTDDDAVIHSGQGRLPIDPRLRT